MPEAVKEYDARLDSKKRLTIRGANTKFYHVTEKKDGTIELSPRKLIHPDEISKKTMQMMELAIKNYKKGKVSDPVDFNELEKLMEG